MGLFFAQNFFWDHTRVRIFIFFVGQSAIFFPEFNIRLYDKKSESNYYFFLHPNQNIFSATLGIRIFFLEKKPIAPPLEAKWSIPKRASFISQEHYYLI